MNKRIWVKDHYRKAPNGKMVYVRGYWRSDPRSDNNAQVKDKEERIVEKVPTGEELEDRRFDLELKVDTLMEDVESLRDELEIKLREMGEDPEWDDNYAVLDDLYYEILDLSLKLSDLSYDVDEDDLSVEVSSKLDKIEEKYKEFVETFALYSDIDPSEYLGSELEAEASPAVAGERWADRAKAMWGVTNDIRTAGYVLPDGDYLNMGSYGIRGMDHREVNQFMKEVNDQNWDDYCSGVYQNQYSSTPDMLCFMKRTGAVRMMSSSGDLLASIVKGQNISWKQRERLLSDFWGKAALLDVIDPATGGTIETFDIDYLTENDIQKWIDAS